eukprot:754978-Hanusia_phi.AAC.3
MATSPSCSDWQEQGRGEICRSLLGPCSAQSRRRSQSSLTPPSLCSPAGKGPGPCPPGIR